MNQKFSKKNAVKMKDLSVKIALRFFVFLVAVSLVYLLAKLPGNITDIRNKRAALISLVPSQKSVQIFSSLPTKIYDSSQNFVNMSEMQKIPVSQFFSVIQNKSQAAMFLSNIALCVMLIVVIILGNYFLRRKN